MPYVHNDVRLWVNPALNGLLVDLSNLLDNERAGAVNYCITRIVAGAMKPEKGWNYESLLKAHGTFGAAAEEFYRRLIAPYEDVKIEKNGDIPEYEQS